jgi:sugar lactone lactonase YvrE
LVPGTHIISDLTVDRHGIIYASDLASDTIYRIDRHGRASVLVRDPRFAAPVGGFAGIAGIVWHPNGFLLVANNGTGALFRVPTDEPRVDEVTLERPVAGADGMALRRDGSLVVVTNSLSGVGANAVTTLRGNRHWSAARTVVEQPWPGPDPTTVAITPRGGYVVSGHLRELATGQPVDTFTLRRVES